MSSAGNLPVPLRPSVFISYASEDRTAARILRDTLAAAGIEVWYDENELGGGDAWDQKIRRQIRDCDYFMPVISATTEARKEGYFRREWRLATDRSLDMADDVLFLLPIAIDDTSENGARVPEKFFTVQWLRAPGGKSTSALEALIRRLLAGEHAVTTRPPALTRAPYAPPRPGLPVEPAPGHRAPPPTMPLFPTVPEKNGFFHGVKFVAEVLWWTLTVAWMLFGRLPKWGRVLVTIWLVFTLFSFRTSRVREKDTPPREPVPPPVSETTVPPGASVRTGDVPKKTRRAATDTNAATSRIAGFNVDPAELARLRNEIAQVFGENFKDGVTVGKPLMVVPFASPTAADPTGKFAYAVFLALYGRLSLDHRGEVAVTAPVRGETAQATLLTRARHFGSTYVINASPVSEGGESALTVRLLAVADGSVTWTETFSVAHADPIEVAGKIAGHVQRLTPKREPRKPKE
ncbi:MAG: toll/interleukin-1 receptor domain-containing protein [Opitutus sp.]|nr:toll/interleukin-1 receptor domain-containing protein [Opitutus sp.]